MNISYLEQVSGWKRAYRMALKTVGKKPIKDEPSNEWKVKMLLSEHSPIRMIVYDFGWENIKNWVTVHLVRHHIGCEKFVSTQRSDRTGIDRDELKQSSLNNMDMTCNAQALINISRKRMCKKASPETREAWMAVVNKIRPVDPILASRMVPECIYRGFCPEFNNTCGFIGTDYFNLKLKSYRDPTCYE